jgi:Rap1a immunity proteins
LTKEKQRDDRPLLGVENGLRLDLFRTSLRSPLPVRRDRAVGNAQMIFIPREGLGALLALIVAASNANADNTFSANRLLPACRNVASRQMGANTFMTGYCMGLIEGLTMVWRSCMPGEVTMGQTAAVIVHWLDQHPERWHEDFTKLAMQAMHDAWPCKTGLPVPERDR